MSPHLPAVVALLLACSLAAAATTAPWMNPSDDPEDRAKKLLAQMTLDEKVEMMHGSSGPYVGNVPGNDRLKIPALNLNDGPQGFRDNAHPGSTTSWPSALTVATTWDEDLMLAWGQGMGKEFFDKGANVQLGPGACLARVPVNGRNFEYVSGEDPFFGYTIIQPLVKGIQSQGVIANAKHYINNNQETNRNSVSENVNERTEHEMYIPPFEGAVDAGVGSFMCSYNKINTTWSCENNRTLGYNLKYRLLQAQGNRAWVMSDWGATHSMSINQGLDQEMPGANFMGDQLKAAIQSGNVSSATVENTMLNILTPMFAIGIFDTPNNNSLSNNVTSDAHNALARNLSAASHVVLKNDNNILPLSKSTKNIVVIGQQGDADVTCHGGGSGQVVAPYVISPLQGIKNKLGFPLPQPVPRLSCDQVKPLNGTDFYQPGNPSASSTGFADCCKQCLAQPDCIVFTLSGDNTCWFKTTEAGRDSNPTVTSGVLAAAPPPPPSNCHNDVCVYYADGTNTTEVVALAQAADVAIVAVSTTSHEGADRANLQFGSGQDNLINIVAANQKNTVVVGTTPGAVLMPWAKDVAAVVLNFMPGQEIGNAMADVLFGDVNPSGRLLLTMPNTENEVGFTQRQYPGLDNGEQAYYDEQLLVGYRWYDAHDVTPAFPFGHGLSYTSFNYTKTSATSSGVTFTVTNTGSRDGATVSQVYLGFPSSAGEPPKQLKGFKKIALKAGASSTVTIPLATRDRSIWDDSTHDWAEVKGTFTVYLGESSRDIRWTGSFSN